MYCKRCDFSYLKLYRVRSTKPSSSYLKLSINKSARSRKNECKMTIYALYTWSSKYSYSYLDIYQLKLHILVKSREKYRFSIDTASFFLVHCRKNELKMTIFALYLWMVSKTQYIWKKSHDKCGFFALYLPPQKHSFSCYNV